MQLNPKPIDFKFGEYISKGIDLMKKDFGTLLLATIALMIFSIIPIFMMLAMGNFYKICYKIDTGKPVSVGEIFNFDDFWPYFLLQVYLIVAILVVEIPIIFISQYAGSSDSSISIFMGIYMFFILGFFIIVMLKAYYMPALITFKKIKDLKQAWNISKIMTKGNLWVILFFVIVVNFLSQLGILLCGIGIFLTMPLYYVAQYFSYKDALEQVEHDEILEIGLEKFEG